MKKQKNTFRQLLAVSTIVALVVTASAPAAAEADLPFADVSGNYTNGVGYLYTNGVVNGTSASTFGTNNSIKRGDTAIIIARALNADTVNAKDAVFNDVGRYAPAVNALFAESIINGVSKTEFNPNGTLTRGAMAKILVEAYDIPSATDKSPFKDAVGVFGKYIDALYAAGITGGKSPDIFGTNSEITRGEFAVLLYKTIKRFGSVEQPELAVSGINDGTVTNTANQTVTVVASEGSDVKMLLGNKEVSAKEEGTYDITLEEGENKITVSASSFGVETTVNKIVTLDTVAPALSVADIPEVVNSADMALKYEAEQDASVEVTLNGDIVHDGKSLTLVEGKNTIVITVIDAPGNKTVVEKVVTFVNLIKEAEEAVTALEGSTADLSTQEKIDAAKKLAAEAEAAIRALPEIDENIATLTTRIEAAKSVIEEAIKNIEIANAKTAAEAAISALPETLTLEDKQAVYDARMMVDEALKLDARMAIEGLSKLEAAELKLEELIIDAATISLNAAEATMKTNKTYQLNATINPSEAADFNVEWSSDNTSVANVDSNGLVTSSAEGTANITATLENGKTAVIKVEVTDRPNLRFNSYGSIVINGVIQGVSTSFYNMSDEAVTVKRVEIYEGSSRQSDYTEDRLKTSGIPTEIASYSQFGMSISYKYGGLWDSEYNTAKYTIQTESGKTYEYISEIR